MLRAFLAAIAAFLLFLGLLFYVVLTASFGQAADGGLSGAPTQEALDDIPPRYLRGEPHARGDGPEPHLATLPGVSPTHVGMDRGRQPRLAPP